MRMKLVSIFAFTVLCMFWQAPKSAIADSTCYTGTLTQWQTLAANTLYFYPLCAATGSGGTATTITTVPPFPYPMNVESSTAQAASGVGIEGLALASPPTCLTGTVCPANEDLFGNLMANINPFGVVPSVAAQGAYQASSGAGTAKTSGDTFGVGCTYYTSLTAGSSSQFIPCHSDPYGTIHMGLYGTNNSAAAVVAPNSDGVSNGTQTLDSQTFNLIYNGTTFDRQFYCSGAPQTVSITTATTTQIVALSGTTRIRVCNYQFSVSGTTTPTLTFEYGTGTNCGTGTTALSGAMPFTTAVSILNSPSGGASNSAFVVPSGQALCILTGGTAPSVIGYLTYVQY